MKNKTNVLQKMIQDKKDISEAIQNNIPLSELKHINFINPLNMNNNLDSSWKYTTKVQISPIELVGRNNAYRDGAADFQAAILKAIDNVDYTGEPYYDLQNIIQSMKKP